jgi:hypothetical protein
MIELELTEIHVRRKKVSPTELTWDSSTGFDGRTAVQLWLRGSYKVSSDLVSPEFSRWKIRSNSHRRNPLTP